MPAERVTRNYMMNTSLDKNSKIGCIVMASGLGKRFGGNKLMASFGGKPMVSWVLDVTDGLFDKRVVVTRNDEVNRLCSNRNVECIYHDLPYRSDAVRLGIEQMPEDIGGCLFCLADQPFLSIELITRILTTASQNPSNIIRPICGHTLGSPVWFPRDLFPELADLPEGKGGNFLAKSYPDRVLTVPVDNPLELIDIDTREVYEELLQYVAD